MIILLNSEKDRTPAGKKFDLTTDVVHLFSDSRTIENASMIVVYNSHNFVIKKGRWSSQIETPMSIHLLTAHIGLAITKDTAENEIEL